MKYFLKHIVVIACFFSLKLSGQTTWSSDPFDQRVFIENKGQFDRSTDDQNMPVLFGARVEGMETYFTATGVCYHYNEVILLNEREKDSMIATNPFYFDNEKENDGSENERYHFSKILPRYLKVEWEGCNIHAIVERKNIVPNYFTYPKDKSINSETIIASACEKITYKEMYPGIDIEYIIPKDKDGIKYTLILHPGADLSVVKMKYMYEKEIRLSKDGNIEVKSSFGDFVDHAPVSFMQDNNQVVATSFQLNGDEVTFRAAYDHSKTLVVDPWTTNPAFATWDRAYDVVYDKNGNVWAYGGNYPWQLAKFSPAGTILWTYNATAMYNSGCCTGSCYGDVTVDENSGSCYLSEGFDWATGARVFKVNTAGVQTLASAGDPNFNEIWRMEYSRFNNKIIGAGGGTSLVYQTILIDTTFTTMTPVNSYNASSNTDNWGIAMDPVANFVYLSTTLPSPNPMIKVPIPALQPYVWNVSSGFSFGEIASVMYVTNGCCANGYNGMAASINCLYAYDGKTLKKFNKNTGALLLSTLTGGTIYFSGGTTADSCDNVYVGMNATIMKYDPLLNLLGSQPTAGTVYDCRMSRYYTKLYVCGDGFVSEIPVGPCGFQVDVQNSNDNAYFNYYPNPANNTITFESNDNSLFGKTVTISIYDMLGAKLKEQTVISNAKIEVELSDLSSGLYLFKLNEGERVIQNGRFVILK